MDFGAVLLQQPISASKRNIPSGVNETTKSNHSSPFKQMINKQVQNSTTSISQTNEKTITNETDGVQVDEFTDEQTSITLETLHSLSVTNDEDPNLENGLNIFALDVKTEEVIAVDGNVEDYEIDEKLLNLINEIINEINAIMQQPIDAENLLKLTKAVERLFQLWEQLPLEARRHIKENQLQLQMAELEEATKILQDLLNIYDKRQSFAKQQVYTLDAAITQQDIKKWLSQAFEKHGLFSENNTQVAVSSNHHIPMSATQQYTFHATDLERIDAISRNLVSDVQEIVQRSNFLKQPGLNELTFTLRPASLGEVTIRLVQVDGTMTVKFLVATQAAKELFEANIHQLKHMFAPNQIIIERDMTISDKQFLQEDQQEPLDKEEHVETNEKAEKNEQNETNEVSFEELLQLLSKEASIYDENRSNVLFE